MKKNKKVSKLQHNAKSEAKVKPQRESILQPTPIISCKKAAITLGISEHDLNQLISEHSVQIAKNYADLPSITKTDLKTISRSLKIDDMRAARFAQKKEYNNRLKQRITFAEMDERYSCLLSFLEQKLTRLMELFTDLYQKMENKKCESALLAAMILYAKCIALSNTILVLLKCKQWHIGSIIREIMECHSLAKYFFNNKDDAKVREEIFEWFRMEKIPAMKIVRTKSAEYFSKFLPGTTPQYHFDLETDNYDTKSKFVHSSFQSIVEVAEFGIKEIAIPTRLNLGENYNLINLVEIA